MSVAKWNRCTPCQVEGEGLVREGAVVKVHDVLQQAREVHGNIAHHADRREVRRQHLRRHGQRWQRRVRLGIIHAIWCE